MASLRKVVPFVLGIALVTCSWVAAKPAFDACEIEGPASEIIYGDLDGDGLKDAVLVDGLSLSIFYQEKHGFSRQSQRHRLEERPGVLGLARLGRKAESLLLMTSEGVTELYFTNRTAPPTRQVILRQPTIIPDALDEPPAICLPLSVAARADWPLLLVPVASGSLQVWQHGDGWRLAQVLARTVETHLRPAVAHPGYTQTFGLNLSLADANGDGHEDLMVSRTIPGGRQSFAFYPQQAEGLFTAEPVLTYTQKVDFRTAVAWVDVNRDGKLDLIRSTVLDEPFFVPGLPSGKVLVGVHLADAQGRVPAQPQQIFRKNDWSSFLPVVDVDGDGFVDLVLGHIPVNTREGFRKIITMEQIDLSLRFYCFRRDTGYPKEPDCLRDVVLKFDRAFFSTPERRLYYEQFVTLNGDFNGDGKKDLLVRDHSRGISVYCFRSRKNGFSAEADFRFSCPEGMEWWEVRDLNGDGVSDLVVKVRDRSAFRIFTSQSQ